MEDGDEPKDTLRARAEESRWKLWFLLEADRALVTGVILGVVFVGLLLGGVLYPGAEATLRSGSSIDYAFQAFVTATITGVTLVLTLNQLVLSQELGGLGDQRDRMMGTMKFRDDLAAAVRAPVAPSRPSQFLLSLVEAADDLARTLDDAVSDEGELARAVDDLAGDITRNADQVAEGLEGAQFGRFEVVSSALNFNYSWKLFTAQRIREEFADELDEETAEAMDELIEVLRLFGPAREHVKTLYFRWELINLSRAIMAAALPALIASGFMVLYFSPTAVPRSVGPVGGTVLTTAVAATLGSLPFVVLVAFIVRIATVTKHTLSIGPFILRSTDRVKRVEWER